MLIPLGILASSGGGEAGAYELIQSSILTSDTASVTFSSIPQGYKHLQLRSVARTTRTATTESLRIRLNGDTSSNYYTHFIFGDGSAVQSFASSSVIFAPVASAASAGSGIFGSAICEILDYTANKNKTLRTLTGVNPSTDNRIDLRSGLWINTNAITSLEITGLSSGNLDTGSRFSLYGIRGE